jgi:hypothetical protein
MPVIRRATPPLATRRPIIRKRKTFKRPAFVIAGEPSSPTRGGKEVAIFLTDIMNISTPTARRAAALTKITMVEPVPIFF